MTLLMEVELVSAGTLAAAELDIAGYVAGAVAAAVEDCTGIVAAAELADCTGTVAAASLDDWYGAGAEAAAELLLTGAKVKPALLEEPDEVGTTALALEDEEA